METPEEKNEQLQQFLHEAVDILDDVKHKLGMFQTQRYYRLKKDMEQRITKPAAAEKSLTLVL